MLDRYISILKGETKPYYIKAKENYTKDDYKSKDLVKLWEIHQDFLKDGVPPLSLKKVIAERTLEKCSFCERRCDANRRLNETGYCKVKESKISSEFVHMGEESELVPSHTIFFTGCNFHCVYCQNWTISQETNGNRIRPDILAGKIEETKAKNVNWVGGDPTPNIEYILKVLSALSKPSPQIWNSNMYLSKDGMKILSKLMDLYLTDYKYGNDECAERLSDVPNYTRVVKRNHIMAEKTGDLLIRHLVLPNHLECCTKPILEWIDSNLENPKVNIMTQYRPVYRADEFSEINRYLNREEKKEIQRLKSKYSHLTGY